MGQYLKGQTLPMRGYFVSTVGIEEDVIRAYIRQQEDTDRQQDQLELFERLPPLDGSQRTTLRGSHFKPPLLVLLYD